MEEKLFSAACAESKRVIAARIMPDLDVLETLEKICRKYKIQYGQVTTCIGSLRRLSMNYVSTANPKPGEKYTTHMELEGAFSVLSGGGLVSPGENGSLNCHIHFTVSGQHDAVYGGHVEKGTRTLTTLDVFITELQGIVIERKRDEQTGAVVTYFHETGEVAEK